MKKRTHLSGVTLTVIILSLLLHACSMNTSQNSVIVTATSTPTLLSNSSNNNNIATATSTPAEPANPVALTPIQNLDPCAFLTSADAEPLVGTALIDITPGSDVDEITGGPLEYCTYKGDDVALVVSFVKSSAPNGSPEWQNQLQEMPKASDPEAVVTPASEIGEQSYWVVTEESVGLSVAKYPYIFILAVGGNIGYSEDYKADLVTLAQKVMDALP